MHDHNESSITIQSNTEISHNPAWKVDVKSPNDFNSSKAKVPSHHHHYDEAEAPPIVFKRTTDMIDQQSLLHRMVGIASPTRTGELPTSEPPPISSTTSTTTATTATSSLPSQSGPQPSSVNDLVCPTEDGPENGKDKVTKSDQQTSIPIRPARVCKPPRQSRQVSRTSALSEYTTQLMFMEALNKKHLQHGSGKD